MTRETVGAQGGAPWVLDQRIKRLTRGFQVAVAGDVALEYADGTTCVWPACAAGMIHPHWGFVKVLTTGTTATGGVIAF